VILTLADPGSRQFSQVLQHNMPRLFFQYPLQALAPTLFEEIVGDCFAQKQPYLLIFFCLAAGAATNSFASKKQERAANHYRPHAMARDSSFRRPGRSPVPWR
jgi:hypothetical protein